MDVAQNTNRQLHAETHLQASKDFKAADLRSSLIFFFACDI